MLEYIDSLGDAAIFSTLEGNSDYLQVEIAEDHRYKTDFTCHYSLFRPTRIPFRLKNASGLCQQEMVVILSKVKWKLALAYLYDIVIFWRTPDEPISIMFDKYWQYYSRLDLRWAWGNSNSLQISSIPPITSFALGASRFQKERFTLYSDSNTRLIDGTPIIFWVVKRFLPLGSEFRPCCCQAKWETT